MQHTFDTIVEHLRKQGCKSADAIGVCLYRGPNGLKCAAGILIPDDKYHLDMENKPCDLDIVCKAIPEQYDIHIASRMQNIHDSYPPCYWESKFKQLAERYNLTYKAPDEVLL